MLKNHTIFYIMSETVKKYQAEGAKETVPQACHIFNTEPILMRKKCPKEGISHMKPDRDPPGSLY